MPIKNAKSRPLVQIVINVRPKKPHDDRPYSKRFSEEVEFEVLVNSFIRDCLVLRPDDTPPQVVWPLANAKGRTNESS